MYDVLPSLNKHSSFDEYCTWSDSEKLHYELFVVSGKDINDATHAEIPQLFPPLALKAW